MGNSKSSYKRHQDDDEQQQQEKEFRLVLGQLDFPKESSPFDHQHTFVSLILFDISTHRFISNEVSTHTRIQHFIRRQLDEEVLTPLLKVPCSTRWRTLSTRQIVAVYYEQMSNIKDLKVEHISLLNENKLERKVEEFNEKNILSICALKSTAYIIYEENLTVRKKYQLIRSSMVLKTAREDLQWLQPFIDYSKQGYRLCGLIPFNQYSLKNSLTISWLFEINETISYDYCLLEYQPESFSLDNFTALLNRMSKQEWRLVGTFDYNQKKKTGEQIYFLFFFQRLKH